MNDQHQPPVSTFLVTVQVEIPFVASPDDAIIWMNSIIKHLEDNGATWPAHVVSARPKGKPP